MIIYHLIVEDSFRKRIFVIFALVILTLVGQTILGGFFPSSDSSNNLLQRLLASLRALPSFGSFFVLLLFFNNYIWKIPKPILQLQPPFVHIQRNDASLFPVGALTGIPDISGRYKGVNRYTSDQGIEEVEMSLDIIQRWFEIEIDYFDKDKKIYSEAISASMNVKRPTEFIELIYNYEKGSKYPLIATNEVAGDGSCRIRFSKIRTPDGSLEWQIEGFWFNVQGSKGELLFWSREKDGRVVELAPLDRRTPA